MSDGKIEIERLYIGNHQRLLHVARAMLKDEDEAGDAVSDVFAKLADGSLVLPVEHPESYLYVTMRNLCLDRIRKMTIRERIERRLTFTEPNLTPVEAEQERRLLAQRKWVGAALRRAVPVARFGSPDGLDAVYVARESGCRGRGEHCRGERGGNQPGLHHVSFIHLSHLSAIRPLS